MTKTVDESITKNDSDLRGENMVLLHDFRMGMRGNTMMAKEARRQRKIVLLQESIEWLDLEDMAETVKSAREKVGYKTQADLRRAIETKFPSGPATTGSIQSGISNIETMAGKRPSDEILAMIQDVLNVTLTKDGSRVGVKKAWEKPNPYRYVMNPKVRKRKKRATQELWQEHIDDPAMTRLMSFRAVPLYAAVAGAEGTMLLAEVAEPDDVKIRAPFDVAQMPHSFGVRVAGDVMSPAYKSGDIVWFDPQVSGSPGNDVLLMPSDGSSRRCLRELVSETVTEWVVLQHNPSQQTTLKKSDWPTCLMVLDVKRRKIS